MDASSIPSSSAEVAIPSSDEDEKRLLRAISAAAPQMWFPLLHAQQTGAPRDSLDEPLWLLRQAGLVQVTDWIGGLGQGFQLTRDGERAVDHPDPLSLSDTALCMPVVAPSAPEPPLRPAIVAPALLLTNVVWFAVGTFLAWKAGVGVEYLKGSGHPAANQTLMRIGALSGSELLRGEWWRLLTCCFVHVGLIHLLANMLMLGILGPVSEELWGRRRFTLIYIASGLAGSCTAMALHPMNETENGLRESLLAGASGSLWGVLLSVVVWLLRYRDELAPGVAAEWGRKLTFAVFLNLLLSFAPGISFEAHLGGGIAGAALAFWLDRRWRPHGAIGAAGVVLLLAALIAALSGFMRYSERWQPLRVIHEVRRSLDTILKFADGR
jgi:rhomboid protease GluP